MNSRAKGLLVAAVDVGVPIGLYYVLRGLGTPSQNALVISSFVPGVSVITSLVRRRRPDSVALFMTLLILASAAVSLFVHDARFLLAKDGWFTAAAGIWFLTTVRAARPVVFTLTRVLLEGRIGPRKVSWDVLWDRLPAFRRVWRVATVIWAVGLLVDAAVRVVMAYTLPIDVVPGLGALQYGIFMVLMQIVVNIYLVPSGVYSPWSPLYRNLEVHR
jgi:hypothetical protein